MSWVELLLLAKGLILSAYLEHTSHGLAASQGVDTDVHFSLLLSYSPSFSKVAWSVKHIGNSCSWWTDHVLEYWNIFEIMDLLEECMCKWISSAA